MFHVGELILLYRVAGLCTFEKKLKNVLRKPSREATKTAIPTTLCSGSI